MRFTYNNKYRYTKAFVLALISSAMLTACSDNNSSEVIENNDKLQPGDNQFGKANDTFTAEEWYPGGELGTSESERSYTTETPATTKAGLSTAFSNGENFFEHNYNDGTGLFGGRGPAWVRPTCIYCHPSYGHGKRQNKYNATQYGNGYLLALYYPKGMDNGNGGVYEEDTYVTEVAGVPQTRASYPFLPPIDEKGINIEWKHAKDEHGNKFADGEEYDLIYPEVSIDINSINTNPKPKGGFVVRLESTIGIQGTGLLDAITDDDIKKQYQEEAAHADLNPMMWDKAKNDWASTAYMDLSNGRKAIRKFNYQLSRASLQQDYAIWEICNVTRKDLHYLYTTKAWAKAMSEDENVINTIMKEGKDANSPLSPYYGDGSKESIAKHVEMLLGLTEEKDAPTYEQFFVNKYGEEMADQNYYEFMVWQRGLAIPPARDLDKEEVKRGKKLFEQCKCTSCHRPSWTTGDDNYWATDFVNSLGKLPTYPNQKIYPYTDLVQHRLYMENDIINGWCRTTPLWGRGLSSQLTGASDRLHDCRARTVIEAIMWHGYSTKSDAHWSVQNFYKLDKADRDAVVAFIEAI